MAELNWKNVTGDTTNAGADSLRNAGSLFGKAFENFSGAVEGRQKRITEANTTEVLDQLRRINTPEEYAAQQGQFDLRDLTSKYGEGNVDLGRISTAYDKLLPDITQKQQAEAARVQRLTDADYARTRGKQLDARADTEFNKQQAIGQTANRLLAENQKQFDYNQQQFATLAENTPSVSIVDGVPVMAPIDPALPVEQQEAMRKEQATFQQALLADPKIRASLPEKEMVKQLTQTLRNQGATASQIADNITAFKTQEKERRALSEPAQVAVESARSTLELETAAKKASLLKAVQEVKDANPISHTLNAEGKAVQLADVLKKARIDYPASSWLAGAGGATLTKTLGDYELNGVTANGEVGIKGKPGTYKVEPWMFSLAMDLAGQTNKDAWGNPTVSKSGFKEILGQIATDPTYKNYEKNYRNAEQNFISQSALIDQQKNATIAKLIKDARISEKNVVRADSQKFLNTLQQNLKR